MTGIVKTNGNGDRIREILEEVENLSPGQKAELLKNLLDEAPGLQIVFGNGSNHILRADVVVQINNSEKDTIQAIVNAIANRIEKPLS